MQYVRFGNTGIQVSRLGLGCMDFTVKQDEETASRILGTALDYGINLLDTADTYGKGISEEVLGRILKGKRQDIILATKFWAKMYDRVNGRGCSRVHIMNAVEDSLRRLQTDYIDLYQLHHPDENTPVEETISTLDCLVKQGKIRYYGVSNHYAWQMAHMLGVSALHNWEPLVSVQCRWNIIDRAVENEIIPFARRFNIATLIYGPLSGGYLSGKIQKGEEPAKGTRAAMRTYVQRMTDEAWELLGELKSIADKYEVGLNKLAYAWLLSKPEATCVLMGGSKPEHFDDLYGVDELMLETEDLERIDTLSERWRYMPFHNQAAVNGAPVALNRW